jgi:hypothetical protein
MFVHPRSVVACAVLAASVLLVTGGAALSAPPGDPPPTAPMSGDWTKCPLARIDRQLVRCDVLTGDGVEAPTSVPVQYPHAAVRELATFAPSGCTGGCGSGSTIGPDRALYVTDGKRGRVLRIDPRTGAQTTFAHGLPRSIDSVGIGGAIDVAFLGHTAYVLVTLVGSELGQPGVVDGIYRVGHDGTATPIADIGSWSTGHPPTGEYSSPAGSSTPCSRFGVGSW